MIEKKAEFEREDRYLVIKYKDLDCCGLSKEDIDALWKATAAVQEYRLKRDKGVLECVVIENDWPEYEIVWKMIEDRMTNDREEY